VQSVRDAILRLGQAHPGLARWLGDRLDLQLPAVAVSILTHVAMVAALAMVGYAASQPEGAKEFRAEAILNPTALDEFARLDSTAIVETDKATIMTPVAGSSAPSLSPHLVETPPSAAPPPKPLELNKGQIALAGGVVLPTATSLSATVNVRGSGAEHVGGVEGAVDRVAVEILRRMEKGRTLVVWAFDASGSLQAERERLGKYIDGVYGHIAELDREKRAEAGGLLTAVVSFGNDRKILTAEPTAERAKILEAIGEVGLDTTGVESTFQTVVDIVRKWGNYKRKADAYHLMVVVVTDEVGDDEEKLEDAIAVAVKAQVPVYVLGSPALFGRADGVADYTDPKTKQHYRNLPVRQGPESAMLEGVRLPFWFDGPQYEYLDAGFGPYALSRMAGATGGIYFVTRMGHNRANFDPAGMGEYRPDWVARPAYISAVEKNPLRLAVTRAAMIAQENLPGQPSFSFPPTDGPEFKEAMKANQELVARSEYTVNMALEPITAAVKRRDHETSRRWQAHYDLIRGRLLALKLRCYEYNSACAKMQKEPRKFTNPASNTWKLVPSAEMMAGDKAAAVADEARMLLRRVIADHPGTPWALMAQRELKDPFGLKWVEANVPPRPKMKDGDPAKKKAAKAEMGKPPEPPKL